MNKYTERLYNGLIKENPTFVLMLGMCPTLAVTTSAINGVGMGLSTTVVLVLSNMLISMLRKIIPDSVRMPAFIVPGIGRKAAAAHKQELRIGKERHERFFIAGTPRSGTDRKPATHIVMTRHAPDDGHRRRAGQAEARPYGRRTGKAGQLLRRHLGGKERQHAQRRGQYSGSPRHRTRIVMRSTIRSAEVSPEISGAIPPELPSGLLWPTSTASNSSLPDDRSTSAA